MTKLVWDGVGERLYETGVDRGVLYPADQSGVAWNGLTGVSEDRSGASTEPYYLDGVKYLDAAKPGDFSATLTAFTYPDEFLPYDGIADAGSGLFLDNQPTTTFGLAYRTRIGNDISGLTFAYKIHLLYNLTASPSDRSYATMGENSEPQQFSWTIVGVPEPGWGFRPTMHAIIDSRSVDPGTLSALEDLLYGNATGNPTLPSLADIADFLNTFVPPVVIVTPPDDPPVDPPTDPPLSGIDGGSPSSSTSDVLDGGTPSSTTSDMVTGGTFADPDADPDAPDPDQPVVDTGDGGTPTATTLDVVDGGTVTSTTSDQFDGGSAADNTVVPTDPPVIGNIDGGTTSSSGSDILDGGTNASSGSDFLDGGTQ